MDGLWYKMPPLHPDIIHIQDVFLQMNTIDQPKMVTKFTAAFVVFAVTLSFINLERADASPAIATGYEPIQICIENCAQCKKMLGAWFEGPLCAESCLKFRGKMIPECENFASIAAFINKI